MSKVRLLVGTRKGAFVLTSDGKRQRWEIDGPHFAGWEMYHLKGSPADPNRLYASQTSGWFGQKIQRSEDGGKTWEPVGDKFVYDGVPGTHQWYDGTQQPWEFKRVWHLEPSLTDPDTVYAGVEDAALMKAGYMFPLIMGTQLLSGVLLLLNRFVPLALALLAPVVVNIVAFHLFLEHSGLPLALVVLALELYLAWAYRGTYQAMLAMRTKPD
jgi:hypothetical protein